ncbi:MAG: hypothetical protein ACK4P2_01255, partial [Hyphomonas sp.]
VDGLGRVTSVSVDGTGIASGLSYHPNGAVAGLTYGNGQVFSQTLTARQQTDRLRSVLGAELPFDLTYAYTARSQMLRSMTRRSPTSTRRSPMTAWAA